MTASAVRPLPDGITRSAHAAGQRTVDTEISGLVRLREAMGRAPLADAFDEAAMAIAKSAGRVLVSGMGKSGIVGRKIAATLSSTGTPAFFIHPAEASHGDLGMITPDDIVLTLSWSGETAELSDILLYCRRFEVPLIAATSRAESSLARGADIVLLLPQVQEACPNRLAPTSSTTVQAAMGDALAVALIEVRGFSPDDFRVFHPKGQLGAQLLRVGDIMSVGDLVPRIDEDADILSAMVEMSLKRFGVTGVVDASGYLVGAFTDGDLRRSLTITGVDTPVRDHMTRVPVTVTADQFASEALAIMNGRNLTQLFVRDGNMLIGVVHVHDILRTGLV